MPRGRVTGLFMHVLPRSTLFVQAPCVSVGVKHRSAYTGFALASLWRRTHHVHIVILLGAILICGFDPNFQRLF